MITKLTTKTKLFLSKKLLHINTYTFSLVFLPNKPEGLIKSIIIKTANTIASEKLVDI